MGVMTLLLASLGACAPKIANRGTLLEPEKLEKVIVGESTRENVLDLLGSPTQVSTFDEKIWYYISRKTEQYSFLDPEIIDQRNIEIRFNEEGIVAKFNEFDVKTAKNIMPVKRETPTYGRKTTFIEQLIGNIGRPGGIGKK